MSSAGQNGKTLPAGPKAAADLPAAAGPYAGLRDREYFHVMLNLDSYEGFLQTARALAEGFLQRARERQTDPGLEPELRPFRYSPAAFEARLDEVYRGLIEDTERYEARRSWLMRTREDVVEWLLQMAPFNQTDGAWLRNIAPVGPIDEVQALLFAIFSEELGGGDPALNHANVYTDLLRSVDIELPDIRSRDYADNPDLLDSAFTLPLFQLVIAEFPQAYLPELLGMTQYLEWGSVELKNMVLLNRHFGLEPQFYELHVAIDNAATGHGAMARRAIELHLERTRLAVGDVAMQAEWQRIWTGYVAFATTGTLARDMAARPKPSADPAAKVVAIIRDRAPVARVNHGQKRLGGVLINDLFADPLRLMSSLVEAGLIVPGDAAGSPFFDLLTPDGPMYTIFSLADEAVWRDWAESLAAPAGTAPAGATAAAFPTGPAERMLRLVETLRGRQRGAAAHREETLAGADPADPKARVREPVAWWFGQPARVLLQAVADPENDWVIPGDAASSRFVTDLVRGNNAMGRALAGTVLGRPDLTWADVAVGWVDAGCPIPDQAPARPLTLLTPAERVAAHPTGAIHGSGSVH
jgi:hypothetical protein